MIAAFLYDTYYCYGIQNSYRGLFRDKQEAMETLLGEDYERQNLELFDLDTNGFTKLVWVPRYEYNTEYYDITDNHSRCSVDSEESIVVEYLLERYTDEIVFYKDQNEREFEALRKRGDWRYDED